MFDLKDETGAVMNDATGLAQVMESLDVFISVKPKPKQLSKVQFRTGHDDVSPVYLNVVCLLAVSDCEDS